MIPRLLNHTFVGVPDMSRTLFYCGITILSLITSSCKKISNESSIKDSASTQESVELVFSTPIHHDVETFYYTLMGEREITDRVLKLMPQLIDDSEVLGTISHSDLSGFGKLNLNDGPKPTSSVVYYVAFRVATRIFVFQAVNSNSAENLRRYKIYGAIPVTYLAGKSTEVKLKTYLEARGVDKERLGAVVSSLNVAEVLIHLFPGVASADKVKNATSTSEVLLGSMYFAGDLATFGLGSKVNIVKKGSAAVVATAGSVRLSLAARDLSNGKANFVTGVDAFVGVTSIGLAAFSVVKIQLPVGKNAFVKTSGEANLLAKHLNRSPDDVLKNGLTREELTLLGIELTSDASKVLTRSGTLRSVEEMEEFAKALAMSPAKARQIPVIQKFLDGIAKARGKDFGDAEVSIALYYELLVQRYMRASGKTYTDAFNEIASFNLLYAGNTTFKANRMLQDGLERPDAFHRIIGAVHSKIQNPAFKSKEELVSALKSIGYSEAASFSQLDSLLFYFQKILPNSTTQKSILYSVKDLSSDASKSIQAVTSSYVNRGVLSTATTIDDAVGFLQSDASKAVLFRFLPSNKLALPIVGDGELAAAAKGLQSSRGYTGFGTNEVVIVTGGQAEAKVVSTTTQVFKVHSKDLEIQVVDVQL